MSDREVRPIYDKGYELRKYELLRHIKNKVVMGGLHGSSVYAQSIKTWSKGSLGGESAAIRNKMQKYGKHLSNLWNH